MLHPEEVVAVSQVVVKELHEVRSKPDAEEHADLSAEAVVVSLAVVPAAECLGMAVGSEPQRQSRAKGSNEEAFAHLGDLFLHLQRGRESRVALVDPFFVRRVHVVGVEKTTTHAHECHGRNDGDGSPRRKEVGESVFGVVVGNGTENAIVARGVGGCSCGVHGCTSEQQNASSPKKNR